MGLPVPSHSGFTILVNSSHLVVVHQTDFRLDQKPVSWAVILWDLTLCTSRLSSSQDGVRGRKFRHLQPSTLDRCKIPVAGGPLSFIPAPWACLVAREHNQEKLKVAVAIASFTRPFPLVFFRWQCTLEFRAPGTGSALMDSPTKHGLLSGAVSKAHLRDTYSHSCSVLFSLLDKLSRRSRVREHLDSRRSRAHPNREDPS